ncbi:DUF6415 family natural product biosynthesis protein [Streptomyces sp. CL7]|uniref:DUF6415 family natural product biosynthesis protein n=1 Tax=Streptomyces sp. CL7 TaxID=3096006 RepID=UPI002A76438B|nr:DUF6415 family natural product biosynthesis protein [Streptomyces sp. CL7]WPP30476.1 DUF6415 family natural product biosynthesis protein [Streptomyces sp. CL7]
MTAPGTVPRPVYLWTPPLNSGQLATVLNRLRGWTAFDGGALLDDIAAALDDVPPAEGDTAPLAERLRGHLARLVTIAVAREAYRDTTAAQLALLARTLQTEPLPPRAPGGDSAPAPAGLDRQRTSRPAHRPPLPQEGRAA